MSKSIRNAGRLIACTLIAITIIFTASFEAPVWAAQAEPQQPKLYKANEELGTFLDRALLRHDPEIVFYTKDLSLMQAALPTLERKLDYCSTMLYGIKHDKSVGVEAVLSSTVEVNMPSEEGASQATANQRVEYYKITIKPKYKYSKESDRKFYNKVQQIAKKAKKKKGVKKRAKYINNYIVKHVKYNGRVSNNRTAFSALMRGKASCQGYSDLFTLIARQSGLKVETVCGYAKHRGKRAYHAWNLVKSGKKWVQIDTTFNDLGSRYKYFMKAKKRFNKNHTLDRFYNNAQWKKAHPIK